MHFAEKKQMLRISHKQSFRKEDKLRMKNYRKYLVTAVVIVLAVAGISQLRIQSVSQHNKEQYQIAAEQRAAESLQSSEEAGQDGSSKGIGET